MEAWVYEPALAPGVLVSHGRGGTLYITQVGPNYKVVFRNGDDETGPSTTNLQAGKWYMVAGVKSGNHLRLYVQQSPAGTPVIFNYTPDATGTSTYRPEGSPTFYVGFSDLGMAPWLNGSLDEVVYIEGTALVGWQLASQLYADPAPAPGTMVRSTTSAVPPVNSKPFSGDSSNSSPQPAKTPATAPKKPSKQAQARAQVRALTASLAHMKAQLNHLIRAHASTAKIAKARVAIRDATKRLAAAQKRLKALSKKH
jgi:hypothetical protein